MIYDGEFNPNLMNFNSENLIVGRAYGFSVVAFNFNGAGTASSLAIFKACTAPSG